MSFIDIHTKNLSRELKNSTTFIDNWAYVPGTSITGDYKRPYAFTSLEEFKNTCGPKGPEGSKTYEYVAGLLNAGIPVLFRRIACRNQDTSSESLGVKKASVTLSHFAPEKTEQKLNDIEISERYGGTFGNDMSVTIRDTGTSYWMDIYYKFTLLERQKLINYTSAEEQETVNQKLMDALNLVQFERVEIKVLNTESPKNFKLEPVINKQLSGGSDFDEALVPAEIPHSYDFIEDKILYQPKFITSGGYTDSDISSARPIAEAMLNLTLKRQDCRALIDLPIGTPPSEQQELAKNLAYTQINNNQAIPSGSICAPWQYMQVGANQLWMPPSFVYLTVIGDSLGKGDPIYTPKAGIANGQVTNIIKSEFDIGSSLSTEWQQDGKVNINPIMRLQGGRYVIAGNSTLLISDIDDNIQNAFSESSIDLAVIEIRRFVYNLATELQYQYNSTEAFETFALRTSKFLDTMRSEGALTEYEISNISTNNEPRTLKVALDVYLAPTIKKIELFLNVAYGDIELKLGGAE